MEKNGLALEVPLEGRKCSHGLERGYRGHRGSTDPNSRFPAANDPMAHAKEPLFILRRASSALFAEQSPKPPQASHHKESLSSHVTTSLSLKK